MKARIYLVGRCDNPDCPKPVHSKKIQVIVNESDLQPTPCKCRNGQIIWEHFEVHHRPICLKRCVPWKKDLSPIVAFEWCLLIFAVLLLALVGSFLHFDVNSWTPLWKWITISGATLFLLIVWIIERKLMQKIIAKYTNRVLEEGRMQWRYLDLEIPQQEELNAK